MRLRWVILNEEAHTNICVERNHKSAPLLAAAPSAMASSMASRVTQAWSDWASTPPQLSDRAGLQKAHLSIEDHVANTVANGKPQGCPDIPGQGCLPVNRHGRFRRVGIRYICQHLLTMRRNDVQKQCGTADMLHAEIAAPVFPYSGIEPCGRMIARLSGRRAVSHFQSACAPGRLSPNGNNLSRVHGQGTLDCAYARARRVRKNFRPNETLAGRPEGTSRNAAHLREVGSFFRRREIF